MPQLQWLSVQRPSLKLKLIYVATSKKSIHNDGQTLNISTALEDLHASDRPAMGFFQLANFLTALPRKTILVDNTGTQFVADAYPFFLINGISIVTPSKKAFAGSDQLWKDIFAAAASSGAIPYVPASVGAGLPLVSTLNDLIDTGDEITKIEGALSGTLSYLFNTFAPAAGTVVGEPWSVAVKKAQELGFTEPDPRDDLRGFDVARKLIIFARLIGLTVESIDSFPVQNLVPEKLESGVGSNEFLRRLPEFDSQMEEIKNAAEREGKVVRYVGKIDLTTQTIEVGLRTFEKTHPIAVLKGSDNLVSFYTKRYGDNPLIIQGAGAGGEVTAMGITNGIIKVAAQIA
jgi:homoserine dehydrogenase